MNRKHRIATEQQSIKQILEELPAKQMWAATVFARLSRVVPIADRARVLDVGAASGGFLIACSQFGYQGEGIEPWEEARLNAAKISEHLGIPIRIVDGTAESIPYEDDTFDVVHASSVIEHVFDVEKAFTEIYRVLKPGGIFWFNTASAMCPVQGEISGFPLFGWYPDSLKRKIMDWAKEAKPHLIGYTRTPAIWWFTPAKARLLLHQAGFRQVHDRWDLRLANEGGNLYKFVLFMIRSTKLSKILAEIVVPGCSYAAVK